MISTLKCIFSCISNVPSNALHLDLLSHLIYDLSDMEKITGNQHMRPYKCNDSILLNCYYGLPREKSITYISSMTM
jgi:hypothetical protein